MDTEEKRNQSLDLLNATHNFPCDFTIKVIGQAEDDFVLRVVDAVQAVTAAVDEIPIKTRMTPNGRHVAVTLEPRLSSAEEVLLIYEQVKFVSGVVMTL